MRQIRPQFISVVVLLVAVTAQARGILDFSVQGLTAPVNTPAPNNDNAGAGNPNVIPLPGTPGPGVIFSSLARSTLFSTWQIRADQPSTWSVKT